MNKTVMFLILMAMVTWSGCVSYRTEELQQMPVGESSLGWRGGADGETSGIAGSSIAGGYLDDMDAVKGGEYEAIRLREAGRSSDRKAAEHLDPMSEDTPAMANIDPRKVIYTGSLTIAAVEPSEGVDATRKLAERMGGYMQQMSNTAIVIRVPASVFQQTIDALEEVGTIIDRQIAARDVTEEFTDQVTRLRNAKALLVKLEGLLAKVETVEDALALETQITRVQTQIEQLEGRLNSLSSKVSYATLSIAFVPGRDIPGEMKLRLPFWWLGQLGLESVMSF